MDTKNQMNSKIIVMGEPRYPTVTHITTRQKQKNKHKAKQDTKQRIPELNQTSEQMDLTDIYRVFHPKRKECSVFSATHGTFSETDHVLAIKHV